MKPHAFVAMPFGKKPAPDGSLIDCNAIYTELLKPAIEAAGLEAFRADEEQSAGDIKADMFQELLIADLVVVDLTLDNPNVWYELGIRHALRARGVVLVQGPRTTQPFDIYTDRKCNYSLKNGLPDPDTLVQDQERLTRMIQATMESWHGRKISPVYQLLENLEEPQWKALSVGTAQAFWYVHNAWENRIDLARKNGRIGDLLVLCDEAPIAAVRAEAHIKAGIALRKAERFDLALEQLEQGLSVDPTNISGQREKGICFQRLALQDKPGHSLERARSHCRELLNIHPNDAEIWALLGRIDKDAWIDTWQQPDWTPTQKRDEASYQDALLRAAIESYRQAFRRNPSHYYSGINTLTLMHLYQDLTNDTRYIDEAITMAGALRFSAECETQITQKFWSKATLADLVLLVGTPEQVKTAYKETVVSADNDWFALNSTLSQLHLLNSLAFKPENVKAGIATIERALRSLEKPEAKWQPKQVFLFSGHMIDAPNREIPRFPADKEALAAQYIADLLDKLEANGDDLALTQGACGGDLLFAEACVQRGVKLQLLQPFEEPEFIEKSVAVSGEVWRERYFDLKNNPNVALYNAPIELGIPTKSINPYVRCNLWLFYTALAYGINKVQFVCLWNGGGGDGPGGTAHMFNEVKRRTGQVHWLDTRHLWDNKTN